MREEGNVLEAAQYPVRELDAALLPLKASS
jgi:hypothetical protein